MRYVLSLSHISLCVVLLVNEWVSVCAQGGLQGVGIISCVLLLASWWLGFRRFGMGSPLDLGAVVYSPMCIRTRPPPSPLDLRLRAPRRRVILLFEGLRRVTGEVRSRSATAMPFVSQILRHVLPIPKRHQLVCFDGVCGRGEALKLFRPRVQEKGTTQRVSFIVFSVLLPSCMHLSGLFCE